MSARPQDKAIVAAMEDDERASGYSDPHSIGMGRGRFAAGYLRGWDAGREELMRRIDAALALLKRFGPKAIAAYNIEVCDLVRDVKFALTTEEQPHE